MREGDLGHPARLPQLQEVLVELVHELLLVVRRLALLLEYLVVQLVQLARERHDRVQQLVLVVVPGVLA